MVNRLSPPPRHISLISRLTILSGGFYSQFGWAFFGFGMIFFWTFFMNSEALHLFSFGNWEKTQGVVSRVEDTSASENDEPVYRHWVQYRVGGTDYESACYFTGLHHPEGSRLVVEYKANDPSVGRIAGSRRKMFGGATVFVLIFPLAGLAFILYGVRRNSKSIDLLTHGVMTRGRLIDTRHTGTTINKIPELAFTFSFEDPTGTSYTVKGATHQHSLLSDEETERILYWPPDPNFAVLYDIIPSAPDILPDGSFANPSPGQASALILPALSLLVHGGIALLWFGPFEVF